MSSGFKERLRDACTVLGTTVEGATARVGLSSDELRVALETDGESLPWRRGVDLAKALRVRGQWLLDGTGQPTPVAFCPFTIQAVAVLEGLTQRSVATWLRIGRNMVKHP